MMVPALGASLPGMVFAFGVALQLCAIEIDIPQIARAIPCRLVVEVTRGGIAAFPAGGDGPCSHFVREFHDRDKAIAARAVPFLGPLVGPRAEGSQRAPPSVGEGDRNARTRVAEWLHDAPIESLVTVDLAPWRLPGAKVG